MNALEKLRAAKKTADKSQADRDNYRAYVDDRVAHGWSVADVAEYRAEVERIMKHGTDDEKASASEFWALKAKAINTSRRLAA